MHNYYSVAFFVWSGFMFAAGMSVGQLLTIKRRAGRVSIGIEPVVSERWEAIKTMAWVMAVVMFISVMYYSLSFTYEQRQCDQEIIARLKLRAIIADSDRSLVDARDKALTDMVTQLLTIKPGGGQGFDILRKYQTAIDKINMQAEANDKQRKDNPLPNCTRG